MPGRLPYLLLGTIGEFGRADDEVPRRGPELAVIPSVFVGCVALEVEVLLLQVTVAAARPAHFAALFLCAVVRTLVRPPRHAPCIFDCRAIDDGAAVCSKWARETEVGR